MVMITMNIPPKLGMAIGTMMSLPRPVEVSTGTSASPHGTGRCQPGRRLGKLLSAQYILVGRASRVGQSYYLVLRLIEVETTRQTTISPKGPADLDRDDEIDFVRQRGTSVVIENLAEVLPGNWKERLMQTGVYEGQKIDYLLEGEGVSEFADRIQGLVSCRARVELRLIKLPGRSIGTIERGVGSGVDLTESLSSKTALEKAGLQAVEALLRRAAEK